MTIRFQSPQARASLYNYNTISLTITIYHFQSPQAGARLCNMEIGVVQQNYSHFQSPQAGARLCNREASASYHRRDRLSVPANRVLTLQPCLNYAILPMTDHFQSPQIGSSRCNLLNPGSA